MAQCSPDALDHHDLVVPCLLAQPQPHPLPRLDHCEHSGMAPRAKDGVVFRDLALTWSFHVFVGLSQTLILLQRNVFVV